MNIFLCCLQSDYDYPIPPYKYWRDNFKPSLEAMGHRVLEPEGLDFAEPFVHSTDKGWMKQYRARTSEEMLRQVREVHKSEGIDLFFSYFYAFHVFPDAISEIGRLGIPTVNFFCDNLRQFHSVSDLVDRYTLNWVPEKEACVLYQRPGVAYVYLPMAASPAYYRAGAQAEIPQVTFIGSADGLRTRMLAEVFAGGLPLRVYGRGWVKEEPPDSAPRDLWSSLKRILRQRRISVFQHSQRLRLYGITGELRHLARRSLGIELLKSFEYALNPSVSHEELLRLGANSAVLLGINRCPHPGYPLDAPLVYSRLRDIEGPMMGACYLTEYCADVAELYDIGNEIAVYRNADELLTESNRLLQDEPSRRKLRQLGQRAALSRHTWEQRFQVLFQTLGLTKIASGGTS